MLQEKIVNHMLDHTGPIRIDSVPINLKETYKRKLLLENDKVQSKDDHLQIESSFVYPR